MKAKLKFSIILIIEFAAIVLLLLLVFFAGKKSYSVTFDLSGGTLISGDTEQRVTQGQSATPPVAVKEGHYLLGWSGSYKGVTSDRTIKAIWEYETSPGIEYSSGEDKTYCEIVGSYPDISGDVYIGAYHNEKVVLGIKDSAFKGNTRITGIYLLDGILRIESSVFEGCTSLKTIDVPSTVLTLGERAFAGCKSLKSIALPEGLEYIGAEAFRGCEALESIVIPSTVKAISLSAFEGCTSLSTVVFADREVVVPDSDTEGEKESPTIGIWPTPDDDNEEPETVTLPSEVKIIGEAAFRGCTALQSVSLPSELEEIHGGAFDGCAALTEIILPESVRVIDAGAFTAATTVKTPISESQRPVGWADGINVVWDYTPTETAA